jgi:hypothetical protein
MIRLTRQRSSSSVHEDFRDPKRGAMLALLELAAGEAKREFDSSQWKKAKDQLRKESASKCAYCEADTAVVAHGDVEHFRPKDLYWWLAYCYDNYLFSCQICNQTHKGNKFPLAKPGLKLAEPNVAGSSGAAFVQLLLGAIPDPSAGSAAAARRSLAKLFAAEGALLLNPYYDNPAAHFAWEADETVREVALVPAAAKSRAYVDQAVECYGLNREELRRLRYDRYETLSLAFLAYQVHGAANAEVRRRAAAVLRSYVDKRAPFAGMSRYFLAIWGLPQP